MKSYSLLFFLFILITGCGEKFIEVYSLDELPGTWRWESTCGMIDTSYTCINASKSNYATIEFGSGGVYTEKHMDTIFLQTNYSIIKSDNMFGTLVLENPYSSRPITLLNSRLIIQRDGFEENYTKIR
jgi:hypothetical protein